MAVARAIVLAIALALALALALPPSASGAPRTRGGATPPNIVYVMLDDLGYADLGVYGNGYIQTPNLDRLAGEGIRMTQFYSAAPACTPTRAAVLTGHYPARLGLRFNLPDSAVHGLPPDVPLISELLRDQGYATAHVGKWHLGTSAPEFVPINRGFDYTVSFDWKPASYHDPTVVIDDQFTVEHPGEHLTTVLTDYAISFIEQNQDGPFFLNLWHLAPHVPLDPPLDWAEQYPDDDDGRFAALVQRRRRGDRQAGRTDPRPRSRPGHPDPDHQRQRRRGQDPRQPPRRGAVQLALPRVQGRGLRGAASGSRRSPSGTARSLPEGSTARR